MDIRIQPPCRTSLYSNATQPRRKLAGQLNMIQPITLGRIVCRGQILCQSINSQIQAFWSEHSLRTYNRISHITSTFVQNEKQYNEFSAIVRNFSSISSNLFEIFLKKNRKPENWGDFKCCPSGTRGSSATWGRRPSWPCWRRSRSRGGRSRCCCSPPRRRGESGWP